MRVDPLRGTHSANSKATLIPKAYPTAASVDGQLTHIICGKQAEVARPKQLQPCPDNACLGNAYPIVLADPAIEVEGHVARAAAIYYAGDDQPVAVSQAEIAMSGKCSQIGDGVGLPQRRRGSRAAGQGACCDDAAGLADGTRRDEGHVPRATVHRAVQDNVIACRYNLTIQAVGEADCRVYDRCFGGQADAIASHRTRGWNCQVAADVDHVHRATSRAGCQVGCSGVRQPDIAVTGLGVQVRDHRGNRHTAGPDGCGCPGTADVDGGSGQDAGGIGQCTRGIQFNGSRASAQVIAQCDGAGGL